MPSTDVLKQFGLSRNPFTDRTAEKTFHDGSSLYVHSDLQGFRPSGTAPESTLSIYAGKPIKSEANAAETTYIFFGKRGSGKTTIRMQVSTVPTKTAYTLHPNCWHACQLHLCNIA